MGVQNSELQIVDLEINFILVFIEYNPFFTISHINRMTPTFALKIRFHQTSQRCKRRKTEVDKLSDVFYINRPTYELSIIVSTSSQILIK